MVFKEFILFLHLDMINLFVLFSEAISFFTGFIISSCDFNIVVSRASPLSELLFDEGLSFSSSTTSLLRTFTLNRHIWHFGQKHLAEWNYVGGIKFCSKILSVLKLIQHNKCNKNSFSMSKIWKRFGCTEYYQKKQCFLWYLSPKSHSPVNSSSRYLVWPQC